MVRRLKNALDPEGEGSRFSDKLRAILNRAYPAFSGLPGTILTGTEAIAGAHRDWFARRPDRPTHAILPEAMEAHAKELELTLRGAKIFGMKVLIGEPAFTLLRLSE